MGHNDYTNVKSLNCFSRKSIIIISYALLVMLFPVVTVNAGDWVLTNPPLTGSGLYDVIFISPSEGFAVGANGVIIHTVDTGRTWQLQQTPVAYPGFLLSVQFIDQDSGFAVGGVYGRTFALMTANGGKEWIDVSSKFPEGGLRSIHINNGDIWVTHWNRMPNISASHDRGNSWIADTIGDGSLLDEILFVTDDVGFACGDKGYIGKTEDKGNTWHKVSDTLHGIFEQLICVGDRMYALGLKDQLTISIDGGNSWNNFLKASFNFDFNVAQFIKTNNEFLDNGFIIGGSNPNIVVRFRDVSPPQTPFSTASLPIYSLISAIASSGTDRCIGVCLNGAIFEISGLADSCRELSLNTGGDITGIDFYDSLNGICGTSSGDIFITSNGGISWIKRFLPTASSVVSITAFSGGSTLVVNWAGEKYLSKDYGRNWVIENNKDSPVNIGDGLFPQKTVFKAGIYSSHANVIKDDSLFSTLDAGTTWRKQGVCSFSNLDTNDMRNCIIAVTFPDKKIGLAVTIGGAVSHTIDSGKTWIPMANIPDIAANDIFFLDSLHGLISGKKSGVSSCQPLIYITENGGKSWNQTKEMHFDPVLDRHTDLSFQAEILMIRGKSLESLWALSTEGPLFSSDSGKTWRQQMLPQYGNRFTNIFIGENNEIFVVGDNSRIWKGTGYSPAGIRPIQQQGIHTSNKRQSTTSIMYDLRGRRILQMNSRDIGKKYLSGVSIIVEGDRGHQKVRKVIKMK